MDPKGNTSKNRLKTNHERVFQRGKGMGEEKDEQNTAAEFYRRRSLAKTFLAQHPGHEGERQKKRSMDGKLQSGVKKIHPQKQGARRVREKRV